MKRVFMLLITVIIFCGCVKDKFNKTQIQAVSSMNNNKDPEIDKINKEKELNINENKIIEKTFLGYKMGSSFSATWKRTSDLKAQKKIFNIEKEKFSPIPTKNFQITSFLYLPELYEDNITKIKVHCYFEFYNDKLYKLRLVTLNSSKINELRYLYQEKYGEAYIVSDNYTGWSRCMRDIGYYKNRYFSYKESYAWEFKNLTAILSRDYRKYSLNKDPDHTFYKNMSVTIEYIDKELTSIIKEDKEREKEIKKEQEEKEKQYLKTQYDSQEI